MGGGLRRAVRGLSRMSGFALSMVLLAIASLVVIPAMVAADGELAWGAIALGQSVGGVAAVAIGYGWSVSGPARVALADPAQRRLEFVEALKVRLVLAVPATAVAAAVAWLIAPSRNDLAALGAVTAASVGLSSNWYFTGVRRPYAMLVLETVPRVGGTVVGILLMRAGAGAGTGLLCMLAGMVVGTACSAIWVLASTPREQGEARPRGVVDVLVSQRHGVVTTLGASLYVAAPLVIVSLVAPAIQPVFALVDKVQRQISVGLVPLVTVLQGWAPHRDGATTRSRVRFVVAVGGALAALLGVATVVAGPILLRWLGQGSMEVDLVVIVLMGGYVAANFFESLMAKVALATMDRLATAARATLVSAVVGLPLVVLGARTWGTAGAVGAVLLGLLVRLVIEGRTVRRALHGSPQNEGEGGQFNG